MAVSLFDGDASVLMVAGLKQSSKSQDEEREKGVMKDGQMGIVVIAQVAGCEEVWESFVRLVCWLIC